MTRELNSRTKDTNRFTPSRIDAALYNALITANRPLAIKELVEITGGAKATVDHTLRYWTQRGLIKRVFLDKCAWHTWAPNDDAKDMVTALADAAEVLKAIQPTIEARRPTQPERAEKSHDAAAQALRAIARLLDSAADRLEQEP